MSRKDTVKARQNKLKEAFLEQLKRTPTIETSCQKVSIARATVYRWIKASKKFEKKVDEALVEGRTFMSDMNVLPSIRASSTFFSNFPLALIHRYTVARAMPTFWHDVSMVGVRFNCSRNASLSLFCRALTVSFLLIFLCN